MQIGSNDHCNYVCRLLFPIYYHCTCNRLEIGQSSRGNGFKLRFKRFMWLIPKIYVTTHALTKSHMVKLSDKSYVIFTAGTQWK